MVEILKLMFSGFWTWVGFMFLLTIVLQTLLLSWSRFLRHLNIRKVGWPPVNLDADGDFRKDEEFE